MAAHTDRTPAAGRSRCLADLTRDCMFCDPRDHVRLSNSRTLARGAPSGQDGSRQSRRRPGWVPDVDVRRAGQQRVLGPTGLGLLAVVCAPDSFYRER